MLERGAEQPCVIPSDVDLYGRLLSVLTLECTVSLLEPVVHLFHELVHVTAVMISGDICVQVAPDVFDAVVIGESLMA